MTAHPAVPGVDRVSTPRGCGALWLCGGRVVAPDPEGARDAIAPGATVVCLNQARDLAQYPKYVDWLRASPDAVWFPMPDFDAPPLADALETIESIADRLSAGDDIIMHCAAGIGRTGTMAMCVLMAFGLPFDAAVAQVREGRPGTGPQGGQQMTLLTDCADHFEQTRREDSSQ